MIGAPRIVHELPSRTHLSGGTVIRPIDSVLHAWPIAPLLAGGKAVAGRLRPDRGERRDGVTARIRSYDALRQPTEWKRCREAGWYHRSRARRALDCDDYAAAQSQARLALAWDDTEAANFLVLGEALRAGKTADLVAARMALEAAFDLEPNNPYVVDHLRDLYRETADVGALTSLLQQALAAGMPLASRDSDGMLPDTPVLPLQLIIANYMRGGDRCALPAQEVSHGRPYRCTHTSHRDPGAA